MCPPEKSNDTRQVCRRVRWSQHGMRVSITGPRQHVSVVERMVQTVKSHHRFHELDLSLVMNHTLFVYSMIFCGNCVNLQPSATSVDKVSQYEQLYSMKLDDKRDLRIAFGDYVLATPDVTDNSMLSRVEPCIALGENYNHAERVWMLNVKVRQGRDVGLFVIRLMPGIVIDKLTEQAARQGYRVARTCRSNFLTFSKMN
jgi:hypothetical protein